MTAPAFISTSWMNSFVLKKRTGLLFSIMIILALQDGVQVNAQETTSTPSETPTPAPTVSSYPSPTPTLFDTNTPTAPPSGALSGRPTNDPTSTPTAPPSGTPSDPTNNPSLTPSVQPTTNPTSAPTITYSATPSSTPTKLASLNPTPFPTKNPSQSPTRQPIASPSDRPTRGPSANPTAVPTKRPSTSPTTFPSSAPSNFATTSSIKDVSMTIFNFGGTKFENGAKSDWESTTSDYIEQYYNDGNLAEDGSQLVILDITTTYVQSIYSRRLAFLRNLQGGNDIDVSYSQVLTYRIIKEGNSDVPLLASEIISFPFATSRRQDAFVLELKDANVAFQFVTSVSPVSVQLPPTTSPTSSPAIDNASDSLSIWVIVGSAVGAGVIIGLMIYFYLKRRKRHEEGEEDILIQPVVTQDDGSTLAEPTPRLGMISSNESIGLYGDQSIATQDYDYSKAYGSQSVTSSAGGTFGSAAIIGAAAPPVANDAPSLFSKDTSFDALYGSAQPNDDARDEYIDVYCPPGKLGVVIDTPDNGAPVVHAVKDSSVVADQIKVGDKVVALDDEDVRSFTAIKVSKMISRKSANPTRKLTLLRTVTN